MAAKQPRRGSAGGGAEKRRRPPAPAAAAATQVWPDRGQVGPEWPLDYLKPELSVLLKSAKELRLAPTHSY